MKKIILSIAAVLTFGIASAQIATEQPPTPSDPAKAVVPNSKNSVDQDIDVPIDPKTIEEPRHIVVNDGDPRKDDLTTKDHIKATPDPSTIKEKEKKIENREKKSKAKKRKN